MRFCILGPFEVLGHDGVPVEVRGAKLRTVLVTLVLRAGEAVTTDQLSDALWGDSPPPGAGNALQTHISKLRRLLDPEMLATTDGAYSLTVDTAAIDATEFTALAAAGHEHLVAGRTQKAAAALRNAMVLWRGPPLAEFEELASTTGIRVRLSEIHLSAREDLLDAELAEGDHNAVIAQAEAALAEQPLRERLWSLLMLALYRSGRQADALRAFQRARDVLAEELGLDPGPELRDLERRILEHEAALIGTPTAPPTARLTNVHPELSSFIGREEETSAVRASITERRLVTVIGHGGVGKTRLATEVAVASSADWPDGTWFVDLGNESGQGASHRALLRTFGPRLGRSDGDLLEWLTVGLANAHLLIVLDNCEHVLPEIAPLVDSMLRVCPMLHVLATSREPLGCVGEQVRRIEPLPLDEAIELFTSRAADSSVELADDDLTANAIRSICTQLDRLPLALELTAARTRVFSATQLASLLEQRSALASTESTSRPRRQQTLAAAVEWSYELLFEAEQRLLARLSVFSGGFTLEAAVAVCADGDLPDDEVGLMLARLTDKSLVSPIGHHRHVPRFRLLRPMHEFAAQRLEELAETDALSRRHVRWIIGLTAPLTAALRGPDALSWTAMVNDEIANMTSAMRWSLAEGDASDGLQIAVNLGWYSFLSANIHDDHPMLLSLLDRATDAPVALRCRAMAWAGLLSIGHSDGRTWALDAVDVARTAASVSGGDAPHVRQQHGIEMTVASIELARSLGDDAILREVLCIGALHIAAIGKAGDQVASLAAELRGIAKAVGDDWHAALSIGLEGLAAYIVGDLEHARRSYDACLVELRRLGDFGTAAMFEICSAETTEFVADLESAIDSIGVAFALGSVGEFRSATILCSVLCWLTARNGEVERSLQLGAEALAAVRRPFNPVIRAQALFALGAAEETAGLVELADAHLNEALAIHQQVRMVRETAMDHRQLGYLATARGRRADALVHHRRALQLALDVGLRWTIMLTARGLAEALLEDEQVVRACELTGISESIAAEYGYVPTADERRRLDLLVERSEVSIGADGVREALASGAASGVAGLAPALSD